MFRVFLPAAAALVALSACAPRSTPYQPASAAAYTPSTYASPGSPGPDEILSTAEKGKRPVAYRKIVDAYYAENLKDPDSRKLEFKGTPYGGLICGTINAKNSMGGYTGKHPFYAVFDENQRMKEIIDLDSSEFNTFRRSTSPGDPGYRYHKLLTDCGFY